MTPVSHAHPVRPDAVATARADLIGDDDAQRLARLMALLADPVRLRALFALVAVDELCVGDLALTLDVTMDQSSYALKLLRGAGLVQSRRDGRVIPYRLADDFPHPLLEHCLTQLLSLSAEG